MEGEAGVLLTPLKMNEKANNMAIWSGQTHVCVCVHEDGGYFKSNGNSKQTEQRKQSVHRVSQEKRVITRTDTCTGPSKRRYMCLEFVKLLCGDVSYTQVLRTTGLKENTFWLLPLGVA